MRKFLLKFAALCIVAICSVMPIKADTNILTTENGWTKITSIPENLEDYYYVFVDNANDLMLLMDVGANQGASYRTMYYKASVNPIENRTALWRLESMANVGGYESCLTIRNADYTTYAMQTEWNAPWNFRTHDQPNPCEWTAVIFAYSADGYWTLQNGKYPGDGYVGPWSGTISEGGEVAANKAGDAIGQFQIYAIRRVTVDLPSEIAKINTLIALCESYSMNSTPNAESYKTTFDAAITDAKSLRDAATTTGELTAAYNALESARQTYVVNAIPAEGHPFDLTFKVVNPTITGNMNGWTGVGPHKYFGGAGFDGTASFVEFCNWDADSWESSVTQTVSSLPNGVYTVKAAWQAASGGATTVTLTANGASTTVIGMGDKGGNIAADGSEVELGQGVAGWRYMSVECFVSDGTMEIIGSSAATAIHQWANFDHVTIALTGALSEEELENLNAIKATLEAAKILNRVIVKKAGINKYLNDAQCAANIEEATELYESAIANPESVSAEEINAMVATLWADMDDYSANVLNDGFESDLDAWTKVAEGQYAYSGICAYGSGSSVNSAVVPTTDIIGQSGNKTLGISAAWTGTMSYTQNVTLPAGKHILTYDAYNSNKGTVATNLTGVTVNGTAVVSSLTSYASGEWTNDVIEFEMAEAGTVTLTVGYKSNDVGSGSTPKLWYDNVKIYSTNVHYRANTEIGKYGTICLPFNAELPENMLLYSVAGVDSKDAPTILYLNKETTLQAGKAYIYYTLDTNDIRLQKADAAELLETPEANCNGLTGTFVGAIPTVDTDFEGEYYYLLSQNKWVKVKSEYAGQVGVKRFRAYLDVHQIADENEGTEAVSYARSMNLGGGANGIEEILNVLNDGNDLFYTVGGQRVNAPVKGLYIKNGMKIIVK